MILECPMCETQTNLTVETALRENCPECSYRLKGPVPLEVEAIVTSDDTFDVTIDETDLLTPEEVRQMAREEEMALAYDMLMERMFQ
jgi:hypothetical protein